MAAALLISEAEYLNTTYRPDVDYVDGHIEERNLGEFDHADLQMGLGSLLRSRQKAWGIRVLSEIRTKVGELRYRIPDICVISADAPREPVLKQPPLLCIEVLSPSDSLRAMRKRVQDYLDMGVLEVWIIAPLTSTVHVCTGSETTAVTSGLLKLPTVDGSVGVDEIFSILTE